MTSEYLLEIENNQRTKPSWQRMNNNTIQYPDFVDAHQAEKIQARNITLPTSGALEDNLPWEMIGIDTNNDNTCPTDYCRKDTKNTI
jgi:hypothetical protein